MAKFKISRDDITNSFKTFTYSKMEKYHTVMIDNNGIQTCDEDVSGYQIMGGHPNCPVPMTEFDDWYTAVNEFINVHNLKVKNNSTGNTIEFIITGQDSRSAYEYEKKINGKIVESGTGFYRDLETQAEKDAWIDAVRSYKQSHGIPMPTSIMDEQIEEIESGISALDMNLLGEMDPIAPTIITAIPKLITDPCDFLSYMSQAGTLSIPLINGVIPQPYEMATYAIKKAVAQIPVEITNISDAETLTAQASFIPVKTKLTPSRDYFAELDALYEEYYKTNDQDIALFETVLEPPYNYMPNTLIYENSEPGEYNYNQLPEIMITDTYIYDPTSTEYNYKEVTLSKIYDRGAKYSASETIRQHIIEAMRNLWVPLRKGWETYAAGIDLDPTWWITSGYRPVGYKYSDGTTQKATGSAHIEGWAIDVQPAFSTIAEKKDRVQKLSTFIYNFLKNNPSIQFDQILVEHTGPYETARSVWVHIGYKRPNGQQRRQYWPSYRSDATSGNHGTMYII